MGIFKRAVFWMFVIGTLIGLYIGYQVGTIRGYERAMKMIEHVINQ